MCNKYTKLNIQKDSALRDSVRCAKSGSHTNTAITGQNAIVSSLVPVRVDDEACFTAPILVALQAIVRGGLVPGACKCNVCKCNKGSCKNLHLPQFLPTNPCKFRGLYQQISAGEICNLQPSTVCFSRYSLSANISSP